MGILLIPLVWLSVLGLFCLGPFGWIVLALAVEAFDQATQAPAKRMLRAAARQQQQAMPAQATTEEPSISVPALLVIALISVLGAVALGSFSY